MRYNSPYLGSPVPIETGPKGQIAHKGLFEHRKKTDPAIVAITQGVWSIVGLTGANKAVIDAREGLIVIDSGNNDEEGAQALRLLRQVSRRPIAAGIYTHSHFCFGTKELFADTPNSRSVPVYAHWQCHDNVVRTFSHEGPGLFFRGLAQFGVPLPDEGPDADPVGIPNGLVGPKSYLPPTHAWRINGEECIVAGERIVVYTDYIFDTTDSLILWFPDRRLAVHNHLSRNFPSMASNAGGVFRNPRIIIEGVDLMRRLEPEYLWGVHGPYVKGAHEVQTALCDQRDALQFIYDQSVRGMNRGMTAQEVIAEIDLPKELAESPELHQTYSEWHYHIGAVYSGLLNWYSGDAADLSPLAPELESMYMVETIGGLDMLLKRVQEAIDKKRWAWAAKLARHGVRFAPHNEEARRLLARALRAIGQATTAWTTRNICLTQAREWEGLCSRRGYAFALDPHHAQMAAKGTWVRALGFRLKPRVEAAPTRTVAFHFTDSAYSRGICIRRCVAEYLSEPQLPPRPGFSVHLKETDYLQWFFGKTSWRSLLENKRATSEQSVAQWEGLWNDFDAWPPYGAGS